MAHKIELLGSLNITKEGQPQTAVLKREKGCALLAYLMVMRQPHSREALADLLWDARSTKAALTNLRRALHFLRPHIPELLILRKTVAYQPSPDVLVDLYGLEAGLNQSSEIQLREALLAYSGPLLDGFYVDDAPRFNEWLLIARERLYQQVRQGFALYAAKCEARGDWAKGEAVARHWLAQDNYDEAAHRFLMRCLAGQRHRKRALAQFELLYQLLADELGAEPEAETIALREQLITEKMPATLIAPQPDGQGAGVVVPKRYDWGEAPNQHHFFGREPELAQLDQWLHRDRLRLITILGIGGQGKTSLAAMLARGVAHELDGVFWRSLVNAPPLDRILNQLLQFFEQAVPISPETTLHEKFSLLLSYMSQRRALIVLDNVETILSQSEAGRLRAEYEEYAQLFQQIATSNHQSCLLLTSRERPIVLERLERDSPLIQTLPLAGIDTSAGQAILREGGIEDDSETTAQLIERYSGNPLALKLVAETIESLFYGDVAEFLVDETPIFDDIRDVLDQQFARLSTLEQEILLWLAVSREFTSPQAIEKWSLRRVRRRQLLEAMRGLQRRALIEKGRGGFTLQNVVTEYLTDHLVEQVIDEVVSGKVDVSGRIALLLTQSKAFIRQSQNRSILKPIGNALIEIYGTSVEIATQLQALLKRVRNRPTVKNGYVAGNLLNLLLTQQIDLAHFDFSELTIRQAYLNGANLATTNFSRATFSNTTFTDTFGSINSIAYSPDGQFVAVGTLEGDIQLWKAADTQLHAIIAAHNQAIWSIAFSPNGRSLASGSADHTICVWSVQTGALQQRLTGHSGVVSAIEFSPDGQGIASASDDHTLRLWDWRQNQCVQTVSCGPHAPTKIAFHPNGQLIASSNGDNKLRLWNLQNGEQQAIMRGHEDVIRAVLFSSDGKTIVSGSDDQSIRVWDAQSGLLCKTFRGHRDGIDSLAMSPNGKLLASGSSDLTVRFWDVASGDLRRVLRHPSGLRSITFSPDGQTLASAGFDQQIRLWDVRSGHLRNFLQGHTSSVRSLAFRPDGQALAAGCADGAVRVWPRSESGQQMPHPKILNGHTGRLYFVGYRSDGQRLVSGGDDTAVALWNVEQGIQTQHLDAHHSSVWAGTFSQDSRYLISGSRDHDVQIWQAQTGYLHQAPVEKSGLLYDLDLSPDGRLLAIAGSDRAIRLWSMADLLEATVEVAPRLRLAGHAASIYCVAFRQDGKLLASGGRDQTVRLWRLGIDTAEMTHTLRGHRGWVWSVAFSPDGSQLASASTDHTVRLWDTTTGQLRHVLDGHAMRVYAVAFSPDGSLLASGGTDQTIKIWNAETGACVETIRVPGPYADMNISGATGITAAQKAALLSLGAVASD